MNKLKMLVLTALAAATVGTGALAAAPSASASTDNCSKIRQQAIIYQNVYDLLKTTGYGRSIAAAESRASAQASRKAYFTCVGF
jgi:hypothetical protein